MVRPGFWAVAAPVWLLALASPAEAVVKRLPAGQERALVHLAYQMGVALAVLVVLLMLGIVAMRLSLLMSTAREKRFNAVWRPKLMRFMVGEDIALPRLSAGDQLLLFRLWCHMHESVRGGAADRLNEFARRIGLDKVAWRFAKSAQVRRQLVGLLALGNLRERKAWNHFRAELESASAVHSLAALRGMLAIDDALAMPIVIDPIARRSDWSPVRVASFLKESDPAIVVRAMGRKLLKTSPDNAIRLLKYLQAINADEAVPYVRRLARRTKNPGVLSASLPLLQESRDLPLLRQLLSHEMWFVRVQAATALGRVGRQGDEALLRNLLTDGNWWVRYRAAQALTVLPFLSIDDVRTMQAESTDGFARDILSQVLAEVPSA
jgi:hypothetical protein